MDFRDTPAEADFRKEVQAWLTEHLVGDFAALGGRGGPADEENWDIRLEWERILGRDRWVGMSWPVELGGRGLDFAQQVIFNEEYAKANAPARISFFGEGLFAPTLVQYGTEAQKQRFLPKIQSVEELWCQGFSEPNAGSDLANVQTRGVLDGDEWVINGEKYFISGAGDPRCKVMICMVRTSPDAPSHLQQSQILVPMDTPGLEVLGPMHVFGHDDAPHGHMHIRMSDVRVPRENILLGEGRGFEISQLRLGPGRIHHCMRAIGAAEKALELMVQRGLSREAFGKPLITLGKNTELVARARIEIEAMRLMVFRAARAMDLMGNAEARVWVSAVKAMVPERVCQIIDQAMQLHGATGLSQWSPLADMYVRQRTIRLADGPDEVHHMVVGRAEIARHAGLGPSQSPRR
jgi:acyl-CoA dehydrogenase